VPGNADELADEERRLRQFHRSRPRGWSLGAEGREPTEEELVAYHRKCQVRRADWRWLRDNLPVGTVFDHLGAACMVISFSATEPPRAGAVAVLDVQVPGGVERRERTVSQLRAMLEPGYVVASHA